MKDYNFMVSVDRLHKTRFFFFLGGGLTKTFVIKRGVGLAKKKGGDFFNIRLYTNYSGSEKILVNMSS